MGRVVRKLEDALSALVTPEDSAWNVAIRPGSTVQFCAHVLAPGNLVRGVRGLTLFRDEIRPISAVPIYVNRATSVKGPGLLGEGGVSRGRGEGRGAMASLTASAAGRRVGRLDGSHSRGGH